MLPRSAHSSKLPSGLVLRFPILYRRCELAGRSCVMESYAERLTEDICYRELLNSI